MALLENFDEFMGTGPVFVWAGGGAHVFVAPNLIMHTESISCHRRSAEVSLSRGTSMIEPSATKYYTTS